MDKEIKEDIFCEMNHTQVHNPVIDNVPVTSSWFSETGRKGGGTAYIKCANCKNPISLATAIRSVNYLDKKLCQK